MTDGGNAMPRDYTLTGPNAGKAIELGLAEADWFEPPIGSDIRRALMQRSNGPAIRDTALWFAILAGTGLATILFWGNWYAALPYLVYCVFYATASDSRWHECSHGTPFASDWMNVALYEISSFMVMRESVVWRWSHNRHHSDTIIVGRDPEIQIPRPPRLRKLILSIWAIGVYRIYYPKLVNHAMGRIGDDERSFVPEMDFPKIIRNARIILAINFSVVVAAYLTSSWLPILLVIVPHVFGNWLMVIHNTPQHAGLAENVLDHRLNSRTVYMNPISRFIYWNMNYHLEHHMFPLVPYHALPKLHEVLRPYCPTPYPSIYSAWRELLPAVLRQRHEPDYFIRRELPKSSPHQEERIFRSNTPPDPDGWIDVCQSAELACEGVLRFDHDRRTYAVYLTAKGQLYATDGVCTHGNTHLSQGFIRGDEIECPKHNGRFNLKDGSPARSPICQGLRTYPIKKVDDTVWINLTQPLGGAVVQESVMRLRVVSNRNVATYIKELALELIDGAAMADLRPGDYLKFHIPTYTGLRFSQFDIAEPFKSAWETAGLLDLSVDNEVEGQKNNYSVASNTLNDPHLLFNIRIAVPPKTGDHPPGIGSSYMFNLKPGDEVSATGPFGDFHIRPTKREMVYIGGGAGMAPLRAHILHLFQNEKTQRKVSFWYGARSVSELFYVDTFKAIAEEHANFSFDLALSEPSAGDHWTGQTGMIHDLVRSRYLAGHPNPQSIEFYLCGPPAMIAACRQMLAELNVEDDQVSFDQF